MRFHYTATQSNGQFVEGDIESGSPNEVLGILTGKGLRPVSIKVYRGVGAAGFRFFGQSISLSEKIFLTRYLALMLRAGTDLFKAIDILINDLDKPAIKAFLFEIKSNLEKGNPFYATFAKYPKYFPPVFINLVKAGEASGNLTESLDNLSVSLTKEQELKNKIRGALIYPIILLTTSFLMLLLLITFALPKIANIFISAGITPPLFSRIVFSVGLFLNDNAVIVFPLVAGAAVGGWYFFTKVYLGRRIISVVGGHLPVLKKVLEQLAIQRFASTFASLMKAGIPIINSLEVTADAVGSENLKMALQRIAREGIAKGLTIGEAFRREPVFPLVVTNLIAISEHAGHTEEILRTLAGFYEMEVDSAIKTLVAFIEPSLLLIIGVLIGTIAISVIVPIYQLVGGI